jgi:hypothetical protein
MLIKYSIKWTHIKDRTSKLRSMQLVYTVFIIINRHSHFVQIIILLIY